MHSCHWSQLQPSNQHCCRWFNHVWLVKFVNELAPPTLQTLCQEQMMRIKECWLLFYNMGEQQSVAILPFCATMVIHEQNVRATDTIYVLSMLTTSMTSSYKHVSIVLYGINEVFQFPLLIYIPALTHPNINSLLKILVSTYLSGPYGPDGP